MSTNVSMEKHLLWGYAVSITKQSADWHYLQTLQPVPHAKAHLQFYHGQQTGPRVNIKFGIKFGESAVETFDLISQTHSNEAMKNVTRGVLNDTYT